MLVRPGSTEAFARREAGGKGFNLWRMGEAGLPVPPWVAMPGRAFTRFVEGAGGLAGVIREAVGAFERGERTGADAEQAIAAAIEAAPLPEAMRREVDEAWAALAAEAISVRSSAADEDGGAHSFAGQLTSYLYVTGAEDAARCLKRCWASGFTERGLAYRRERKLRLDQIRVAVIFQRMIDPDASGVLFTCDPVEERLDRYLVSSVYGVGEGLVSGALDADNFRLDAASGAVTGEELADKAEAFRRGASGHCRPEPVPHEKRALPSLDKAALAELHALGKRLAERFRRPQDAEWAIEKGKLWLLQTRPVTTLHESGAGYLNLWDNSNIVESYGGVTSPLSFTFALNNYRNVYVQFCEILNVPPRVVKDMDSYLGNMLGAVNGRVFYNLYNWYKLVGVLPGFRHNRQFMETMMGVSEALSDEVAERIRPHPSWESFLGKIRRLKTGIAFFGYHLFAQTIVDRFLRYFHRHYERYRKLPFQRMTSDELFQLYLELDRVFLSEWKAPIINDFLCMVHFGVLKKLTAKWLADLDENVQNDLLAGEGNLESAEPTKQLIRMAGMVARDEALERLIETTDAEDLYEALHHASAHRAFYEQVLAYIDRFGFRCMNEMKLEERDLYTDPAYLFVCLKNYLRSGTTDLAAYEAREKALREGAEAKVRGHLSGWRRRAYFWSLGHARKAVKNRENTRFARTRIYGVARRIFRAMGQDLAQVGALEDPEDIFFLTREEVYGVHQGTLPCYDLKGLIEVRKRAFAGFAEKDPKVRFTTRGPVYWLNRYLDEPKGPEVPAGADYDLKGLPCCPGVIEGVVKVVMSAKDDLRLDGEILVTPRTDPGWVPLYPSVSGLLVERGSLLSHSAIVAREMGLPAIVAIPGLIRTLKSGMRVRMDGKAGTVKILDGVAAGAGG
jgi:pyruvate,water dikinase